MSYYKLLGVTKTADDTTIRAAYKKGVVLAHPDKGGSDHHFRQLQTAYDTLKDKKLRQAYDDKLRDAARAKAYSAKRPPPLPSVKHEAQYRLRDGEPYIFETAPDKMKTRFRHGDIVDSAGQHGCIVGLASDGVYWCRGDEGYATLLFTSGFGGDRDIKLVYRANLPGHVTGRTSQTPSRPPRESTDAFDSSPAAFTPRKNAEKEFLARQKVAQIQSKLKILTRDETTVRAKIQKGVDRYLVDFKTALDESYKKVIRKLRTVTTTPRTASAATPRKVAAPKEKKPVNATVEKKFVSVRLAQHTDPIAPAPSMLPSRSSVGISASEKLPARKQHPAPQVSVKLRTATANQKQPVTFTVKKVSKVPDIGVAAAPAPELSPKVSQHTTTVPPRLFLNLSKHHVPKENTPPHNQRKSPTVSPMRFGRASSSTPRSERLSGSLGNGTTRSGSVETPRTISTPRLTLPRRRNTNGEVRVPFR